MKLKTIALLLATALGTASALTPVETHGALTVKSGKLTDKNGNPVTLRGMSFYWSSEAEGGAFYNASCVKWLVNDWKVSVLRLAIGVDVISTASDNYLKDDLTRTMIDNKIDAVVSTAVQMGIYVIIDWHTEQIHQSEAVSFFTKMAQKYGAYPNVLWEPLNEPNGPNWGSLVPYHNAVISAIRKYSKSLVIVGNPGWSSSPAESPDVTDALGNVAYSLHAYTSQHQYLPNADAAIAKGRCVFVTEWGATSADGASNFNWGSASTWLSGLETRGISHCNWDIGTQQLDKSVSTSTVVQASAAIEKTARPTGSWASTDLTASGTNMRSYLRTKNAAYTGPAAPPPTFKLVADTIYPSLWGLGAGVDSVASSDGRPYKMLSATAGGSVTYNINPNNKGYFEYNMRVKSTSASTITITANGVAARTLQLSATPSWTTILDTMSLPTMNDTIPLKLAFSGPVSIGFIKFVRKINWTGTVAPRRVIDGQIQVRPIETGLRVDLPSSQDWTAARVVDLQGKTLWSSAMSVGTDHLTVPAAKGVAWLLLDGATDHSRVTLPPVR